MSDINNDIKRILSLDGIRSSAVLFVILNHVLWKLGTDLSINISTIAECEFTTLFWIILWLCFFVFSRLGVPLFLMLTGYLLLDKDYDEEWKIKAFYKNNLLTLIITTQLWIILLNIFDMVKGEQISEIAFFNELLFLARNHYDAMWYMPKIIGLYLFLPFVSIILKKLSTKTIIILLGITAFYCLLPYDVNFLLNIFNIKINLNSRVDMSYSGGVYGCYIIIGYLFKTRLNSKIYHGRVKNILFFMLVLMQLAGGYNVGYESLLLLIISAYFFQQLLNYQFKFKKLMLWVSKLSIGFYFLQGPVIGQLNNIKVYTIFNNTIYIFAVTTVTFIICGILSYFIYANKILRKYLLRTK